MLRKPDVTVRARRDVGRSAVGAEAARHAACELVYDSGAVEVGDPTRATSLCEPDVAVRARRDADREAVGAEEARHAPGELVYDPGAVDVGDPTRARGLRE